MAKQLAHKLDEKQRTSDVVINADISFAKMMLSDTVLSGLNKNGFLKPSPIQLRAIPLARAGFDLLVKAKAGTGKTIVFATAILEAFQSDIKFPQSLILAPTREIAVQIESVLNAVGETVDCFHASSFIGGLEINDDRQKMRKCRSVVGTPGRILHLFRNRVINTDYIKIVVLDESDKLMTKSFRNDVEEILNYLPARKQMLACSATFDQESDQILTGFMNHPIGVTPKKEAPILIGVKQFGYEINPSDYLNSSQDMQNKINAIQLIFSKISFKQCLLFSNSQSRAESYCNFLERNGWPTKVITGTMEQKERLAVFRDFRNFRCRILTATDLMARGVDSENVNLVINLEVPSDPSVYLHRIGRCGRFGSHGIAITLLSTEDELIKFRKMLGEIGGTSMKVLRFQPAVPHDIWDFSMKDQEVALYGEICGLTSDSIDEDEQENNLQMTNSSIDLIKQNLALLEISKLLADKPESNNEQTCDDLFESYSMDANQSTPSDSSPFKVANFDIEKININNDDSNTAFLDAIARLNLYPTEIKNTSVPKSISVLETNGSVSEEEIHIQGNLNDSSDDEDESIFLKVDSDQSTTPTSCDDDSSDESTKSFDVEIPCEENSCDEPEPIYKRNSRNPQKIWEQMYWKQVNQIQNYIQMSRNIKN